MENQKCGLILALDLHEEAQAFALLERLNRATPYVKIGPRLYASGGVGLLKRITDMGYRVFLDIKLHDIPNTVASAVDYLAQQGLWSLTLHTSGGEEMMRAACEARDAHNSNMKLFGVSVLTSLAGSVWGDVHPKCDLNEALVARAEVAATSGIDGLVCSPADLELLQGKAPSLVRVVPGIRTGKSPKDDQKRVATASEAASRGAGYIVVGRPIVEAPDPCFAAQQILKELNGNG